MTQPTVWTAPAECTLPTTEQPLRVDEFGDLFATALRSQTRPAPAHLRLVLDGTAEVEATARDLIAKETACCSFFDFAVERDHDGQLQVDVRVPERQVRVLDALSAIAAGDLTRASLEAGS